MSEIAHVAEATLSDEAITEWEKRIGLGLRVSNVYNSSVSLESIRNFSNGIGDINPLYRDEEYAKKTRYDALVASPAWTASVFPHWVLQGLPGIHADHSASNWEFLKPVYVSKEPHSKLWGIMGKGAPPQGTDEAAFLPPASWGVSSGDFYEYNFVTYND